MINIIVKNVNNAKKKEGKHLIEKYSTPPPPTITIATYNINILNKIIIIMKFRWRRSALTKNLLFLIFTFN